VLKHTYCKEKHRTSGSC